MNLLQVMSGRAQHASRDPEVARLLWLLVDRGSRLRNLATEIRLVGIQSEVRRFSSVYGSKRGFKAARRVSYGYVGSEGSLGFSVSSGTELLSHLDRLRC